MYVCPNIKMEILKSSNEIEIEKLGLIIIQYKIINNSKIWLIEKIE